MGPIYAMGDDLGHRLRRARLARGLSMEALCSRMGSRVTKQSISKYEKGLMRPDSEVMQALADALDLSVDSLLSPSRVDIAGLVSVNDGVRLGARLSERAALMLGNYLELLAIFGGYESFSNPLEGLRVSDDASAGECADMLRERWSIPEGRLDVVLLLESHGVFILEDSFPFDACAAMADDVFPVILLEKSLTAEEKSVTALAELAKLLLEFDPSLSQKRTASLCRLFARELMISSSTMVRLVGYSREEITLSELRDVQAGYGLSVDSLMDRAFDESIISPVKYSAYRRRKRSDDSFREAVEKSLQPRSQLSRMKSLVHRALGCGLIDKDKATELLGGESLDDEAYIELI